MNKVEKETGRWITRKTAKYVENMYFGHMEQSERFFRKVCKKCTTVKKLPFNQRGVICRACFSHSTGVPQMVVL